MENNEGDLLEILNKYFNYTKFKSDIQKNAIKSIVSGKKDVYVSMPTGSGKSLCYHLPGLVHENKVTVVISPLIALIKNQVDFLLSRKIRAHTINSTSGSKERDQILGDLKAKKTETKFLYITPEQAATNTFQDLFKLLVKFQKIALVAVDEAHCVSSWGHDFRKDYLKLGKWRREYPSIQWIALTATAPKLVKKDVLENLGFSKDTAIFQVSCFRHNLYYDIVYKNTMRDDFIELKDFINKCLSKEMSQKDLKGPEKPCVIIYCRKKETTESVALGLRKQGLTCKAFHSGLKPSEKGKIQDEWMNGTISVIVATISFGMGIDKAQVRLVVHWDISQNIAAYYQESGRAGRDGKKSYCRLYYDRDEVKSIMFILNQELNKCKDEKSDNYLRAKNAVKEFGKIVDHCESASCRHLLFTEYFGDPKPKCIDMCDFCKSKSKCLEKLQMFQKLSAGYSTELQNANDDPSDLYEGGRSHLSKKGGFDDYSDDQNSEGSSYHRSDRDRKADRSFIDKQFALRKMQAAAAMSMTQSTSISRVKSASSTDTKVLGLTISTREQNLTMLVSVLKNNMEKCALNNPAEHPLHALVYKDLEDIGAEIEYTCFNTCKAVSIYRRNVAKEIHNIRTSDSLFAAIKNHVPQKHKSHGGDYKTIVNDLKDRYGKEVVDELEDEMNKSKNSNKKHTKKDSSRYEGKTQSKINEFFQKNNNIKSENDIIEISSQEDFNDITTLTVDVNNDNMDELDDPEIMKLQLKKQNLVSELEQLSTDEKSPDNDIKQTQDIKSEQNDKIDDQRNVKQVNEQKRKNEDNLHQRSPAKKSRIENEFRKASDMLTVKSLSSIQSDDMEKKRKRNKNKISEIVVSSLNSFYRDKKITGPDPKSLFKLMARKITHHFYESDADKIPESKTIRNYICEVFYNCGIISCEADFRLNDDY